VTTAILEREAVGMIRDNLLDVVAAHALRDNAPGNRGWKVSLSTVDGTELVVRRGLQGDFAQRLAAEASSCILTLRTGREYPEDRIDLPVCTTTSEGVTIELRDGAVSYTPADGTSRPSWKPDMAARLDALRNMTLRQLAENKLIPAEAWRRLGAAQAEKLSTVYWRLRGLNAHGTKHAAREWHLVAGSSLTAVCGKAIPSSEGYEVHDSRTSRVSTGRIQGCPLCLAIRDKEGRQ
jgi:hypothetical protein